VGYSRRGGATTIKSRFMVTILWVPGVKRLYRIYYNTFDDELHEKVKNTLKEKYGAEIVDHKSRLHPDFRYLELLLESPGLEDEIRDLIRSLIGSMYVKVDWIDTTK